MPLLPAFRLSGTEAEPDTENNGTKELAKAIAEVGKEKTEKTNEWMPLHVCIAALQVGFPSPVASRLSLLLLCRDMPLHPQLRRTFRMARLCRMSPRCWKWLTRCDVNPHEVDEHRSYL